jgi:Right handed beta helix region
MTIMKSAIFPLFLLCASPTLASADHMKVLRGNGKQQYRGLSPVEFEAVKATECGATLIFQCDYEIREPGRYVLGNNLQCSGEAGISIFADDVHLDCQDHAIRATGQVRAGIYISDAARVTISNCKVRKFKRNLLADTSVGLWTDLSIFNSSFNNAKFMGAALKGSDSSVSVATIIGSSFHDNGEIPFSYGRGLETHNVDATIVSSNFKNNLGENGAGYFAFSNSVSTLVDCKAIGNGSYGFGAADGATLNLINSKACETVDGSGDIYFDDSYKSQSITQGVTCDTSIDGICEFTCSGFSEKVDEAANATDTTEKAVPVPVLP